MRTILLTALCAVAIGTQAKVANDTIDKYIIDKQHQVPCRLAY